MSAELIVAPTFAKVQRDGETIARISAMANGNWSMVGYPHAGGPDVPYHETTCDIAHAWMKSVAQAEALSGILLGGK